MSWLLVSLSLEMLNMNWTVVNGVCQKNKKNMDCYKNNVNYYSLHSHHQEIQDPWRDILIHRQWLTCTTNRRSDKGDIGWLRK